MSSAIFSACPKCGVRLSQQSMQFHQQLCGKNANQTGRQRGSTHSPGIGAQQSESGRQKITAQELEALRLEVYGRGSRSPVLAPQRAHRRDEEPAPEDERVAPRPSAGVVRTGGAPAADGEVHPTVSGKRRHIDVWEQPAPGLTPRTSRPEEAQHLRPVNGRVWEANHQTQLGGPDRSHSSAEVAELRGIVQRLGDEMRRLRDDVSFLQRENEALRDAVAEIPPPRNEDTAERDHTRQELRELWLALDGISARLVDVRQENRWAPPSHQEQQFAAKAGGGGSVAEGTVRSRGVDSNVTLRTPVQGPAGSKISTDEYVYGQGRHNGPTQRHGSSHHGSARQPSQSCARYEEEAPPRAGTPAGRSGGSTTRPALTGRSGSNSARDEYSDVTAVREVPPLGGACDVSMRKETESLVSQALQRRAPPAANYTTRSSSRTSDSSGLEGYFNTGGSDLVYSRQGSRN
jgi:hypothetical protein